MTTASTRAGDMAGKVAIVTGGGTGIGLGVAVSLARAGAKVAVAVTKPGGDALDRIGEAGGEAMEIVADVASEADVERAVAEVIGRWGRLDAIVNNAGIEGEHGGLADTGLDTLERVLRVNVGGVFLCMREAIKRFLAQGSVGAVVNIASGFSFVGFPSSSPYAASKGAVMALTRSAALEYAKRGVRVNAVCPMDIDTPMLAKSMAALPGGAAAYADSRIMGRLGRPEEVGEAVVFLCSDRAGFTTGSALMVDGGYTAQ